MRDADPWKDYVAERLRHSDARHDAQETELRNLRGSVTNMAAQLELNTTTTNEVKTDTTAIREALVGLRWIGRVAKWFAPVAAIIAAAYGIWTGKL